MGEIQDGIGDKIMDSKFIEIEDLTEKQIARGSEAAEEMLTEDNDFLDGR